MWISNTTKIFSILKTFRITLNSSWLYINRRICFRIFSNRLKQESIRIAKYCKIISIDSDFSSS